MIKAYQPLDIGIGVYQLPVIIYWSAVKNVEKGANGNPYQHKGEVKLPPDTKPLLVDHEQSAIIDEDSYFSSPKREAVTDSGYPFALQSKTKVSKIVDSGR